MVQLFTRIAKMNPVSNCFLAGNFNHIEVEKAVQAIGYLPGTWAQGSSITK
jgi:hypothetical protein